jgi:hypothetical protein
MFRIVAMRLTPQRYGDPLFSEYAAAQPARALRMPRLSASQVEQYARKQIFDGVVPRMRALYDQLSDLRTRCPPSAAPIAVVPRDLERH